jgi:Zn-dependent protease
MSDTVQNLIIAFPVLIFSISLHEMMHAFTSDWLGDDTARLMGRISLNPLRHIDPFFTIALPLLLILSGAPPFGAAKPVQVNFHRVKWGEFGGAIVGVIGPLTNIVLAVIAALVLRAFDPTSVILFKVLAYGVIINIGLGIFNLIPWPPLDGSRLLYAFAPRPLQEFMETIESLGMIGLVIFILFFYQFIGPGISHLVLSLTNGLTNGIL